MRLRGKININQKFGLSVRREPCISEATHGGVHADGGARGPSVFGEVPGRKFCSSRLLTPRYARSHSDAAMRVCMECADGVAAHPFRH